MFTARRQKPVQSGSGVRGERPVCVWPGRGFLGALQALRRQSGPVRDLSSFSCTDVLNVKERMRLEIELALPSISTYIEEQFTGNREPTHIRWAVSCGLTWASPLVALDSIGAHQCVFAAARRVKNNAKSSCPSSRDAQVAAGLLLESSKPNWNWPYIGT